MEQERRPASARIVMVAGRIPNVGALDLIAAGLGTPASLFYSDAPGSTDRSFLTHL